MAILGIDLGGTKLAASVFTEEGNVLFRKKALLEKREGNEAGNFVAVQIKSLLKTAEIRKNNITSIGISVPGISYKRTGTVWAPNIPGWIEYPLLDEVKKVCGEIPVLIDSDRACSILGETWQGNAKGCTDAIYLAVGTGIGAGILVNGEILRGSHDIAGAIGWMALNKPFRNRYVECGCFEYHASGEGIAKVAQELLREEIGYKGELKKKKIDKITSYDIFASYDNGDYIAQKVINQCIEYWGMAVANLVTLFNPEKIIFGGGVFGPAAPLLPAIFKEALKWAQPISIRQVTLEISSLAGDAAVYGAGYLALRNVEGLKYLK